MKKSFFALIFFLAISSVTVAQIVHEEGSIKMLSGESLNGVLDYSDDISYNIFLTDSTGIGRPVPLVKISYVMMEDGSKFVPFKIKFRSDSSFVLLKAIIESDKISLYTSEITVYGGFFVYKDNKLFKLENSLKVFKGDKRNYNNWGNEYIGILHILMEDRPDLSQKINKTRFLLKDIIKLILKYDQGLVSYYRDPWIKKESNWLAFGRFSNYSLFLGVPNIKPSLGYSVGFQLYGQKNSRSSIKVDFNYSEFYQPDDDFQFFNTEFWFQFEFVRLRKYIFYLNTNIINIGYVRFLRSENDIKDGIYIVPRLSSGLGIEYRPNSRFSMFAELNNLFAIRYIPTNFSFGFKYDFGSVKGW